MMTANDISHHVLDPGRLAALHAVALLDTPTEQSFDRLSWLAARFVDAPVALVSLVDADRQFFKSCIGLPEPWRTRRETPLSHSFCQHNRVADQPLRVEDARIHPLFKDNLAVRELDVIAYLGIPLVTSDGYVLGSFCVIDSKPRQWTDEEVAILQKLAGAVMTEIHLRAEIAARQQAEGERDECAELNQRLRNEMEARKQVQERHDKLEAQLHQAQKMEAIGRLAGGVAHDLNNLLSPVLGYGELLLEEPVIPAEQKKFIRRIMRAGMGARDLVRQLLAFSRKQTLALRPLDINRTIEDFSKLVRRTIPEDIEINLVLSSDRLFALAEVGQIEQIVINLCVNAADAMPDGGKLTIETGSFEMGAESIGAPIDLDPGLYAVLAVSDTGCGMNSEACKHIFEPFFTTKGEKGTGLGLATVFGIVKQHGGSIWFDTEPGKGTTFTAYLPLCEQTPIEDVEGRKAETDLRGSETILLVEDEQQVRDLTLAILQRQGYTILTASDSDAALATLASHNGDVHLVLTDVVLPGMNGRELYEQVVKDYPDMKVLYMSGYADDVIAHKGVLEDGIHFIQKPFSVQSLAEKVREALQPTKSG